MSLEDEPPCDEFFESGLAPDIIGLLDYKNFENPALLSDAMWIICNMCSTDDPKYTAYAIDRRVE